MSGAVSLRDPVTQLKGVGPVLTEKLAALGIRIVADLLFHLPSRYEDRTRVCRIGELLPGQKTVIEGKVQHTAVVVHRRIHGSNISHDVETIHHNLLSTVREMRRTAE